MKMVHKKMERMITVFVVLLIYSITSIIPLSAIGEVQTDEFGWTWDYDNGTCTDPDGNIHKIEEYDYRRVIGLDSSNTVVVHSGDTVVTDEIMVTEEDATTLDFVLGGEVIATDGNDASLTVTAITADVEESTEREIEGAGVWSGEGQTAELTVTESISVDANISDDSSIQEWTYVDSRYVTGLNVNAAEGGTSIATVQENVSVSTDASPTRAVRINAEEDGLAVVEIGGNINVDSESRLGVTALTIGSEGTAQVSVDGDVTMEGRSDNSAVVVQSNTFLNEETGNYQSGSVSLTIQGSVVSSGSGISIMDPDRIESSLSEEPVPVGDSVLDHVEYGRFYSDGEYEGSAKREIYYDTEGGFYHDIPDAGEAYPFTYEEVTAGGIDITIGGDVSAEEFGLMIGSANDTEITIEGTLSGGTAPVALTSVTNSENLQITVWEVKPNEEGNIVVREAGISNNDIVYEQDEEAERAIQYIIKIDPEQTGIISTDGTKTYNGHNVARQGDKVIMRLNVPEGYEVVEAYCNVGQTSKLLQDADGNYFLEVPRGGGVMLSVKLQEKVEPVETVAVQPQAKRAIVTFDLNGGTLNGQAGTYSVNSYIGKKLRLPGTPVREGYTFIGWYASDTDRSDPNWNPPEEGSEDLIAADGEIRISGDIFMTAIWRQN